MEMIGKVLSNGFQDSAETGIPPLNRISHSSLRFLEHFAGQKLGKIPVVENMITQLNELNRRSIMKRFDNAPSGAFTHIDEVEDISPEEFQANYLNKARPLVIRGAARNWECFSKWTPEFFRDNYGDDEIVLTDDHIAKKDAALNTITLREIVDNLQSEDISKYARFVPILAYHPELFEDFDVEWLADRIDKHGKVKLWGEKGPGTSLRSHLFLGRQGAKTEVHCALTNNMFVNVYGRKQWYLISPDYDPMMYAPVNWGPGLYGTELSPDSEDFERFPLQRYIGGYKFVLEPGDILFNPPFWWHHVKNITNCISIGIRWYNFANAMKASRTQNLLALCATSPSMYSAARNSVEYWKHLKKQKDQREG